MIRLIVNHFNSAVQFELADGIVLSVALNNSPPACDYKCGPESHHTTVAKARLSSSVALFLNYIDDPEEYIDELKDAESVIRWLYSKLPKED